MAKGIRVNLGEPHEPDGIWYQMGDDVAFLDLVPDVVIPTPIGNGLERYDFSITPLDGVELPSVRHGPLFSLLLEFHTPGEKRLGFQQVDTINPTYYSDEMGTQYFWDLVDERRTLSTTSTEEARPALLKRCKLLQTSQ